MPFGTRGRALCAVSVSIFAMCAASQGALAQDIDSLQPQAGAAATNSDAIVVTARRTAEDIQSVPVSVTAFSAETLRQASINDTQDLLVKTPGVFLAGSGGRLNSNFSIRGQSKALAGNSAPGVISYFAEVPQPTLGSSIPTFDLASVQVLKGPQGTLFGRNTTGGAILYYPTAPSFEVSGYVSGSYGNYDAHTLEGALNVPLVSDKVALRVAGQYQKRDGWTRNIGVGDDANDLDNHAIRASLLIEPDEAISNLTIFEYYKNDSTGGASVLFRVFDGPNALSATGTLSGALDQLALQQARGPRVIESDVDAFERAERIGVTNRTEIELSPAIEAVNIFGYRSTEVDYFSSVDGLPTLISDGTGAIPAGLPVTVVGGRQSSDVEQFSNELQFRGDLFDDRLEWLLGGFYLKSRPTGPSGTYIPVFILPGITDAPFNYSFYEEESKALFANFKYDLGGFVEGLQFNAGIRYTWDDIEACVGGGVSPDPVATPEDCRNGAANIRNASVNTTSSKAPTWTVGLDWQVNSDLFLYVVTRRGYRAGGINTPTLGGRLAPFQAFDPEKVTDIEAGIRSDFNFGEVDVQFNASPFVGWYNNVQVPISGLNTTANCGTGPGGSNPPGSSPDGDCDPDNDPSGGTLLVNAGETRVAGLDLSAAISPVAGLSFNAAATFLDLKSRSLTVPGFLASYLASPEVPFNLVPKTTISAGMRWTLPLQTDFVDAVFSADYYHSSSVQSSDAVLPAYDLVNARLDFNEINGTGLDASLFMRNVFDEEYLASANVGSRVLGINSGFYGAPRTYGVQLRYRFGQ